MNSVSHLEFWNQQWKSKWAPDDYNQTVPGAPNDNITESKASNNNQVDLEAYFTIQSLTWSEAANALFCNKYLQQQKMPWQTAMKRKSTENNENIFKHPHINHSSLYWEKSDKTNS